MLSLTSYSYYPNKVKARNLVSNEPTAAASTEKPHNFTVAICLVVSDGEAYLEEWILYHLLAMEIDAIYIYDNSENYDLRRWFENTRQHPVYNRVEVHHRPGKGNDDGKGRYLQAGAYQDCIEQYGTSTEGPRHDYL